MDQSEETLLRKFQEILAVSHRVERSSVAEYLEISTKDLFRKLITWGKTLPFKIDGEFIVIEDAEDFTKVLERQFELWGEAEATGLGKDPGQQGARELSEYHGVTLGAAEYRAMVALEQTLGKAVPHVPEFEEFTFGYATTDTHVISLGLGKQGLKTLPPEIGSLVHLQELELYGNKLTTLPDTIQDLQALARLVLYANELTVLPAVVTTLESLKELSITHNHFTELPEMLGSLKNLEILKARVNQLTSLPESTGNLAKLQFLGLGSNKLTSLPASFGNLVALRELFLFNNQLRHFPESICNLGNLQKLSLYKNTIHSIPDCIGQLRALQRLEIYENELSELPPSMVTLPALSTVLVDTPVKETEVARQLKAAGTSVI